MKYAALTLGSLSLALLTWGSLSVAHKIGSEVRVGPPVQMSVNPLADLRVNEQGEVRTALDALREVSMDRMKDFPGGEQANGMMVRPARRLQSQSDSIFASSEPPVAVLPAAKPPLRAPQKIATSSLPLPRVSLVMQTGGEDRAMVDGRLVGVGDVVAEGLVVKSIAMESVTFGSKAEEFVVSVPLERLRVLGAFPVPPGKGNQ